MSVARLVPRLVPGAVLGVWAGLAVAVGATLMAGHWYTLPVPEISPQLAAALHDLRPQRDESRWLAIHVLYAKCGCSQRIFDHLFETDRPAAVDETILLVGADSSIRERAATAGLNLKQITREELKQTYFMESAPLFVVLDSDGAPRYVGGYTERKQGYDVQDLKILAALQSGQPGHELPLYGCGVSQELQDYLDPIGVKY
ncbi:MAG: hypothetical protein B7733_18000 [Myxococcales bacterium FL481]|nr:MAG: hypothetical protein B7733_18000 [Myxococcales bacterium FL481]